MLIYNYGHFWMKIWAGYEPSPRLRETAIASNDPVRMQLLGIGMIPFFLSTLFQYLFAALDQQKRFLASTVVGSTLRLLLLLALIPPLGFVGPAAAFVLAETAIVTIWMVQLARLDVRANLGDVLWRPLMAGTAMAVVLFAARDATLVWQLGAAGIAVIVYALVLLALKTFSAEEVRHAREGLAFLPPFVASWTKKLKRDS